ncbi:MAG: hypothetical protein ABI663_22035 [Chryseolinea sp.]
MDINDYVQLTRTRSARTKRQMQIKAADKKLIRFHKEEIEIRKAIWNLGWTELKPPVQRGFIRFFVLREYVRREKQPSFFEKILEKINTEQWSYRKDFKRKRRRLGKKIQVVWEQSLREVGEGEFFGKKFTEQERLYFYEALTHPKRSKTPVKVYRFIESWRFVLRIQPNMITKVRVKDLDLEGRRDEINRYFSHDRRHRLWKLLDGSSNWGWDRLPKKKYEDPLHNRSFSDILDEYFPEPKLKVLYRNPRYPRVSFCYLINRDSHPFTKTTKLRSMHTWYCGNAI